MAANTDPVQLQLDVVPVPDVSGFEVRVIVSGRHVLRSLQLIGMDPDDILRHGELIPPAVGARDVVIGRCTCGEVACDSMAISVSRTGENIVWTRPQSFGRRWPVEPVIFDATQYLAEVDRARNDFSWETPDRTAARLIEERLDHSLLRSKGLRFQWGSKYSRAQHFSVSLVAEPGPYQVILHVPWAAEEHDALVDRMLRILTGEPGDWSDVEWIAQYDGTPVPPQQAGARWRQWSPNVQSK